MTSRPPKRELLVKSMLYRAFVIAYELCLALLLGYVGLTVSEFVVANNLIKLAGYVVFEFWWFRYLRTRFRLLERIILERLRKTIK